MTSKDLKYLQSMSCLTSQHKTLNGCRPPTACGRRAQPAQPRLQPTESSFFPDESGAIATHPAHAADRLQNKILLFIAVRWPTCYLLVHRGGTITC
jgi:hypothetical protein